VADHFFARLKGLLLTKDLPAGHGLLLKPCSQIHMFGMSYAIDAVFIDAQSAVVGLVEAIKPGQLSPMFRKAKACLELPAGTISGTGTKLGDKIELI
jgi:uncharacterized membrane protein (UPF0127 family)